MSKRLLPDEESQRVLVLLKLDAKRIFERIRDREPEYLYVFSVKRTRDHFKAIFKNRYKDVPISDLKKCGQEIIVSLDNFYSMVDEMHWYLNHTENMPSTVEDNVKTYIRKLTQLYETLNLYINAELGIGEESPSTPKVELLEGIDEPNEFSDELSFDSAEVKDSQFDDEATPDDFKV